MAVLFYLPCGGCPGLDFLGWLTKGVCIGLSVWVFGLWWLYCAVCPAVSKLWCCGELATPLLTVKPVGMYSTSFVQYLYISCYLSDNKPVLSYLLSRLLPQCLPCGVCPVVSALWCLPCGVCPVVSALWCLPCGVCPVVSALWCLSRGVWPVVSVLWCCPVVLSCGIILWRLSCNVCTVISSLCCLFCGVVCPMMSAALWWFPCAVCPVVAVLWRLSCGNCPGIAFLGWLSRGNRLGVSILWWLTTGFFRGVAVQDFDCAGMDVLI